MTYTGDAHFRATGRMEKIKGMSAIEFLAALSVRGRQYFAILVASPEDPASDVDVIAFAERIDEDARELYFRSLSRRFP